MVDHHATSSTPQETPLSGCFVRVWGIFGFFAVGICLIVILRKGPQLSVVDIVYWVSVASLLVARYWDIVHFQGTTADGKKATFQNWKHYSLILGGVSALLWIASHTLTRFVRL